MDDDYISENDPATAKAITEKFGFCLVRNVFSGAEMARLESDLARGFEEAGGSHTDFDLSLLPSLRWILSDPRIQRYARALLGDRLVYYRETNVAYEPTPGPLTENPYTEYHCDARGRRDNLNRAPVDAGRIYPCYRFAIYFRNYRDYSGGLKVAPGSHLRPYGDDRAYNFPETLRRLPSTQEKVGKIVLNLPRAPIELFNVPSVPGDLVVFSLRTFHAGGAQRFRDRPRLAVLPLVEQSLQHAAAALFVPNAPGPRNAIFLDFGAPTEEVDFYVKWRALHRAGPVRDIAEYLSPIAPGIEVRNDKIIVAMAMRLLALREDDAAAEVAHRVAAGLLRLCELHAEFSVYHPLFDRNILTRAAREPLATAGALAEDIVRRRAAVRQGKGDTAVPAQRNEHQTALH